MKHLYSILAAAMLLGTAVSTAQAAVSVSVDFFYDKLDSYGDWREVGDYGYCWQPRDVDPDWSPYSDGHWIYTDAGWTWDSEEPFSWAVYHYGRWARVDRVGWVWVPGTEWGPAWVSWRRSPRHVGWAPLPPEARFTRTVGFSGRVDADYDIGPTNYRFVEVRNFGAPRLRTVIVEPRENITIIHQTTNITRITYVNNVVYNEGPQYDVISRESAQPIRRLKLERREEFDGDPRTVRTEQLRTRVDGDSLRVVTLPFDTKAATPPRKLATKVEKAEVDRGWKNAGPPAEVAKLRTKIKSEPAAPAEPSLEPKAARTAETPAAAERKPEAVPTPAVPLNEKTAKGKARSAAAAAKSAPAAGTPEGAPASLPKGAQPEKSASVEDPTAPDQPPKAGKPGKLGKAAKPVNPEVARPPTAPTAAETAEPPQAGKGRNKVVEAPRPPAEASPEAQARMRKKEGVVERSADLPPAAAGNIKQKVRPGRENAQPPNAEQPAGRSVEGNAPNKLQPRPEAKRPELRPQGVPAAAAQPPAAQPTTKGKAKGKGKDEKGDEKKPDEAR